MKKSLISEFIILAALIIILALVLTPYDLLMPMSYNGLLTLLLVVVFLVFAGFVWQEKVRDEREEIHRLTAGRFSFIAGAIVLIIGIVVQSFSYSVDKWLVFALISMVFSKLVVRIYSRINN